VKYRIKVVKHESYTDYIPQYKIKYGFRWHDFVCSASCGNETTNYRLNSLEDAIAFVKQYDNFVKKDRGTITYFYL
jgi:hypothetical protein